MNVTDKISTLEAAHARCDAQETSIFAQLALLRAGTLPSQPQAEAAFLAALTGEIERCAQIEDKIGLLTLRFDEHLSSKERDAMLGDVCELARPGDLIGSIDEDTFAVAIPWTDPSDTLALARALEQIAQRHGTPQVHSATIAPQPQTGIDELFEALEPLSPARDGARRTVGRSRGGA